MSERVTRKDLDIAAANLNEWLGRPDHGYEREDGQNVALVGHFYVEGAYGGYALYEITNEGGGVEDVSRGHISARELWHFMRGMAEGVRAGREAAEQGRWV